MNNPYQAYKQQSVMTMTTSDMLKMLYDGIIKEVSLAKVAFQENNLVAINEHLIKAQKILQYLKTTLDMKYDIAKNLEALYDYFLRVLIKANVKKDPKELDSIIKMVSDLADTYEQAGRSLRAKEA